MKVITWEFVATLKDKTEFRLLIQSECIVKAMSKFITTIRCKINPSPGELPLHPSSLTITQRECLNTF